jgi:hypothetical protein
MKSEYKLGAAPLTESLVVAQEHVKSGFRAFFLHNSRPAIVMEWLPQFFRQVWERLTIFDTGHGAQIKDLNGGKE